MGKLKRKRTSIGVGTGEGRGTSPRRTPVGQSELARYRMQSASKAYFYSSEEFFLMRTKKILERTLGEVKAP